MFDEPYVFLSYSRKDGVFALKLAHDLKAEGMNIWMDKQEIRPSSNWDRSLEEAVDKCGVMLALISPEYLQSEYCQNELALATDLKKTILPLLITQLEDFDRHWPIELESVQLMDFTNRESPVDYSMGISALLNNLKDIFQRISENDEHHYLTSLAESMSKRVDPSRYVELVALVDKPEKEKGIRIVWPPKIAGHLRTQSADKRRVREQTPRGEKSDTDQYDRVKISHAVKYHDRFILLGEPGSGKTETMCHLVREAAEQRKQDRLAPLPVYIALRELSDRNGEVSPAALVHRKVPFFEFDRLKNELRNGGIRLYLDGLNEMGIEREKKAQAIKRWIHPEVKYAIVSCRDRDYTSGLDLNLPDVRIKRLEIEEIQAFAHKYIGDKAASFLELIKLEDESSPEETSDWYGLVRNPLLLTILIESYSEFRDDLPKNRGSLFKVLVDYLLETEKEKGSLDYLPVDQQDLFIFKVKEALSKLAFSMMEQEMVGIKEDLALCEIGFGSWLLPLTSDEKKIARQMLNLAKSATLLEANEDKTIGFYHHLIQEYFAAEKLKSMSSAGILKTTAVPKLDPVVLKDNSYTVMIDRYDGWWDQVVFTLFDILLDEQADLLITELSQIDPHLAARCASIKPKRLTESTLKKLIDKLVRAMRNPTPEDYPWSGAVDLDFYFEEKINDSGLDRARLQKLQPKKDDCVRNNAAVALAYIGPQAVPELIRMLKNPTEKLREMASMALTNIGRPCAKALLECASTEEDVVGQLALQCLAVIIKTDPTIAQTLEDELNKAADSDAEKPIYYLQIGKLFTIQERHPEAMVAYSKALELKPEAAPALEGVISSSIALDEFDAALNAFDDAIERRVLTAQMCFDIGFFQKNKNNKDDAIAALERGLKLNPYDAYILNGLGDIYYDDKNYQQAFEMYKQAERIRPKEAQTQSRLAAALMLLKKYPEAVATYKKALSFSYELIGRKQEGLDIDSLGFCHECNRDLSEAIACFHGALEIAKEIGDDNDELQALDDLERVYGLSGMPNQAIEVSKRILCKLQKQNNRRKEGVTHGAIGLALLDLGRINEAKKYCEKALQIAIEIDDKQRESGELDNVGACLFGEGDIENAIKKHDRALNLSRKIGYKHGEGWICFNLSAIYLVQNQFEKAINYAKSGAKIGVELDSVNIITYSNLYLALACTAMKKLEDAVEAIKFCISSIMPKTAHRVHAIDGIIQIHRGNFTGAKRAFEQSISEADGLLEKTDDHYQALESKGLAYSGLAIMYESGASIKEAIKAYRNARCIVGAKGIIKQALFIFDLLAVRDYRNELWSVRLAVETPQM